MLTTMPRKLRSGFTLIELLVVIAIIGILAALTTAAVQRVRLKAKETTVVDEIQQLTAACAKFKQDFGFNVPQEFTIPTSVNRSDANYVLLTRMFRAWPANRDSIADGTTFATAGITPIVFRGTTATVAAPITLKGSQCLVFFLGGPELQGFTASGPYDGGNNTSKKGPYYEFKTSRLDIAGDTDKFSYRDPFGTPYAFFSSGVSDRYDPSFVLTINGDQVRAYGKTASTTASSIKWLNSGGVQIITAGYDQRFGPGVRVNPGPPVTYNGWDPKDTAYSEVNTGFDDMGNFNSSLKLGVSGAN